MTWIPPGRVRYRAVTARASASAIMMIRQPWPSQEPGRHEASGAGRRQPAGDSISDSPSRAARLPVPPPADTPGESPGEAAPARARPGPPPPPAQAGLRVSHVTEASKWPGPRPRPVSPLWAAGRRAPGRGRQSPGGQQARPKAASLPLSSLNGEDSGSESETMTAQTQAELAIHPPAAAWHNKAPGK